jgi:predicted ester cyclase
MSEEQNKAALRRLYAEAINKGNLAILNEVMAPDYVYHGVGGVELKGPGGFGQYVAMLRTAFPDLQFTLVNVIAEGDYAAHRFTLTGTHKGDLRGIAPTGKRVTATGNVLSRFAGGKEAEAWMEYDTLALYQQLGMMPLIGRGPAGI